MDDNIKDMRFHTMDAFIEKIRPPVEMRDELDMSYTISGQEIIIQEIRPDWQDPRVKISTPIARTKYVKSRKTWNVYWMRADLKWHLYDPCKTVKTLDAFLELVNEDAYGCFWG